MNVTAEVFAELSSEVHYYSREHIDALDEKICELLAQRRVVSWKLQAARMADGGARVDLARERQVISRYQDFFGGIEGRELAYHVLHMCRGEDPR